MPQLACNYSPQLVNLLHAGSANVDWIKLSRWDVFAEEWAIARPLRPALLHVFPDASILPQDDTPWDRYNEAIAACDSPHVALHLKASPEHFEADAPDTSILDRLTQATAMWAERIDVPLLVENVPYYGFRGTLRAATDPQGIARVCAETGAGLLLDLAHARVAAWHRKEEVRAYVGALPLERVQEIHVCGPRADDQGLRDRHEEMSGDDYDLLEWTLARVEPLAVSLEYGGTGPAFANRSDSDALLRQLIRLRAICEGL